MNWILVLLIPISGFVKGIDIDTVATFKSKAACEIAAQQIVAEYSSKKPIKTLCVATEVQDE